MRFSTTILTVGFAVIAALPAVAQNRDSDGDVISVIYLDTQPVPGGGVLYSSTGVETGYILNLETASNPGASLNLPQQISVQGVATATGTVTLPQQVSISGTTYQVEQAGSDVYLRPRGNANRILANVVQAPSVKRVNPTAFGLD